MLKNIIKIGMLAGALFIAGSTTAQEKTYAPEYPHYGFWSNWSIGAEIGWGHQFGNGLAWGHGSDLGLNFIVEKELNHVWDVRFIGGTPGLFACKQDPCTHTEGNYDRFGRATAGFKFGILDACKGYNPDRKANLYLAVDGGMEFLQDEPKYGKMGLFADLGLGYSYKVCEKSTLFVEADLQAVGAINSPISLFKGTTRDYFSMISFGYLFNFGPTAADLELIAMRAQLTQENLDKLNKQINDLNNTVAEGKQTEQRLKNTINDLEETLAKRPMAASSANSDSLRAVIDQIKADQLNYYALPFSILYDVDQWKVSEDQMVKVKAIARVIKDTENARFKVVGFCDKSGSDAYNMKLSEKRANELKRLLVEKYGIAEDRIDVDYKGKSVAFGDISFSVNRRASVYRVIE